MLDNYPDNYNAALAPDAPYVHRGSFDVDAEIVVEAMMQIQDGLGDWRDVLVEECPDEAIATVERAVEAVLARAKMEAMR